MPRKKRGVKSRRRDLGEKDCPDCSKKGYSGTIKQHKDSLVCVKCGLFVGVPVVAKGDYLSPESLTPIRKGTFMEKVKLRRLRRGKGLYTYKERAKIKLSVMAKDGCRKLGLGQFPVRQCDYWVNIYFKKRKKGEVRYSHKLIGNGLATLAGLTSRSGIGLRESAELLEVKRTDLLRILVYLSSLLKVALPVESPLSYLPRYLSEVSQIIPPELHININQEASRLCKLAKEKRFTIGKAPQGIVAATILVAAKHEEVLPKKLNLIKQRLSAVSRISEVTLRSHACAIIQLDKGISMLEEGEPKSKFLWLKKRLGKK